jgi:hypothetical protein
VEAAPLLIHFICDGAVIILRSSISASSESLVVNMTQCHVSLSISSQTPSVFVSTHPAMHGSLSISSFHVTGRSEDGSCCLSLQTSLVLTGSSLRGTSPHSSFVIDMDSLSLGLADRPTGDASPLSSLCTQLVSLFTTTPSGFDVSPPDVSLRGDHVNIYFIPTTQYVAPHSFRGHTSACSPPLVFADAALLLDVSINELVLSVFSTGVEIISTSAAASLVYHAEDDDTHHSFPFLTIERLNLLSTARDKGRPEGGDSYSYVYVYIR